MEFVGFRDCERVCQPSSGTYTFCVRARDIYGTESEMKQFRFSLLPPFYLQWYCLILYTVAFGMLLFLLFKWRMRSLLKEKERLEALVGQRTKQLVQQKNEIEEKSLKLEKALKELGGHKMNWFDKKKWLL